MTYYVLLSTYYPRQGACVLELIDLEHWPNTIYMRTAYLLGLDYVLLSLQGSTDDVRSAVQEGLKRCAAARARTGGMPRDLPSWTHKT